MGVKLLTFETSEVDGDEGMLHAAAALPHRKSLQYPLDGRLGGPPSSVDVPAKRKILVSAGN